MARVYAPFTEAQVAALKVWQFESDAHPFTCCGDDGACNRLEQFREGALIPSKDGLFCPCGKYKQSWAHDYMVETK